MKKRKGGGGDPLKKHKTGVGQSKVLYSVTEKLKQNQYGTEGINTSCGHLLFARENKNKKREQKCVRLARRRGIF